MSSQKVTTHCAYVGAGSNCGDRMRHIQQAGEKLAATGGIAEVYVARFFETVPVGPAGTALFLNTVLELHLDLAPGDLWSVLSRIETALGRPPAIPGSAPGSRSGARTIDLDLLAYDDLVFQSEELIVPHPAMHRREFVLRPFCDLAPDWLHPELGMTAAGLLAQLEPSEQIVGIVDGQPNMSALV